MKNDPTLESFDPQQAKPSEQFRNSLLGRMKLHHSLVKLLSPIESLTRLQWSTPAYYAVPVALVVIVPAVLFAPSMYQYGKLAYVRSTADTQSIYSAAMSNNQALQAAGNRNYGAEGAQADKMSTSMIADPRIGYVDKAYSRSESSVKAGPAVDRCRLYYSYDPAVLSSYRTESHYFMTKDGNYYSKTVTYGLNNAIIEYSLNTPTESYEYKGGSYAVRHEQQTANILPLLDTPSLERSATDSVDVQSSEGSLDAGSASSSGMGESTVLPAPDTTVSSDTSVAIDPEFNLPEPTLVRVENENGVEYYVYEVETEVYCNGESPTKGFSHQWINPKTKQLYKEQTYLESVSGNNLVIESSYSNQSEDVELAAVINNFNFDLNVEVRTKSANDDAAILAEYLTKNNLSVYVPTNPQLALTNAYSFAATNEAYRQSYVFDRNFYPTGALGDHLYNQISDQDGKSMEQFDTMPLLEVSTSNNSQISTHLSVYKQEANRETILNTLYTPDLLGKKEAGTVTIDGTPTSADVYTITFESFRSNPGVEPMMLEEGQEATDLTLPAPEDMPMLQQTSYVLIFEYNGYVYTQRIESYGEEQFAWQDYVGNLKKVNVEDLKTLLNQNKPEPVPAILY